MKRAEKLDVTLLVVRYLNVVCSLVYVRYNLLVAECKRMDLKASGYHPSLFQLRRDAMSLKCTHP